MKQLFSMLITVLLFSCEQSEGLKFGTLQKVSHKTFPCDYYEIQVGYESGVAVQGKDGASGYQNAQDLSIDKEAFDTIQQHVGDKIVFSYKDDGFQACGSSKHVTTIKFK